MAQSSASASLPAGNVIAGRYLIERLLGQGGMGAVYAVIDTGSMRRVALKRLDRAADPKMLSLFEREYHTLSGLRHPCIVEAYEYGSDDDGVYYTMELIQGSDLSRQAPMPWRETCIAMRDVASILGLLHARRLLHRDLSPRNLLRMSGGRLKLIDFGALAPFGPSREIVGTPPFMAPEVLHGRELDQRSDLYALGALGYWLLTGVHAYPAKMLTDLPRLWEKPPTPVPVVQAMRKDARLEPCPPELDELVRALLRIVPDERPENTADLIARLNVIAELEPESDSLAAQGYLASKVFVGRTRERDRAHALLARANDGEPQALLLESDPGLGRTRLLEELNVLVRLEGAISLRADASSGDRPLAMAIALTHRLAGALPAEARRAAAVHSALLARLPEDLRIKLGVPEPATSAVPTNDERVRLQQALCELFLAVARERTIALLIDDLHACDDDSQALVALLAHTMRSERLLIVATAGRDAAREASTALERFRSKAERAHLLPLTRAETVELLRSIFGEARFLERVAERLHRASEGNPSHCLELAEHLVRSGAAVYEEGSWTLPQELTPDRLPRSRSAAHLARLERLSPGARSLARLLSVPHHGVLSTAHCLAAAEIASSDAKQTVLALSELQRHGVFRQAEQGYRFAHENVRLALLAELDPPLQATVHRKLGEMVLAEAGGDVQKKLEAAVHFVRGGHPVRARALIEQVRAFYSLGDVSTLRGTAPLFEELFLLLRECGHDAYVLVTPLGMLALAGYQIDYAYAAKYGDLAMRMMEQLLRVPLARTLARYLGRKLALLVALLLSGLSFRRRRPGPTAPDIVRLFLTSATSLAAAAAVCLDPDARRYAAMIEPLTALGKDHAASVLHDMTLALATRVSDHFTESVHRAEALLARLQSDTPIRQLSDAVKANFHAGCHFSIGITECWRDDTAALRRADVLEHYGPLYAMSADHLRGSFYASQGDLKRAAHYRERVEMHAVQLGSVWQAETWAPAHAAITGMRTQDAAALKRAAQDLGRLSKTIPSLEPHARRTRAAYLVLRGKHAQAAALLEEVPEEPRVVIGWTRGRGLLARALNGLGEHARAREVCLDAISHLIPEDYEYTAVNLPLQIELANAESGLGEHEAAAKLLDQLLARHMTNQGTVTLGSLHEARAKVALAAGDLAGANEQLAKMEGWFRPTGVPSLIERVDILARQLARVEHPAEAEAEERALDDTSHVLTRLSVLRTQLSSVLAERAQQCLQVSIELSRADAGFILATEGGAVPLASLGAAPDAQLLRWAASKLEQASEEEEETVLTSDLDSVIAGDQYIDDRMRHRLALLWDRHDHDTLLGALVLGCEGRVAPMVDAEVLGAISGHLAERSKD